MNPEIRDIHLLKVDPLVVRLDGATEADLQVFLQDLLAWSTGERDLVAAIRDYLREDDFFRAVQCLVRLPQDAQDVLAGVEERWHAWRTQRLDEMAALAREISDMAGSHLSSAREALQEMRGRLDQLPAARGRALIELFSRLDPRILQEVSEWRRITKSYVEEHREELQRQELQLKEKLRDVKAQADRLLDRILFEDRPSDQAGQAQRLQAALIDAYGQRDITRAQELLALLQQLASGQPISTAHLLVPSSAPSPGSPPRPATSLTWDNLSRLARGELEPPPQAPPGTGVTWSRSMAAEAFLAREWEAEKLERYSRVARALARGEGTAEDTDLALGAFLISEAKLRLQRDDSAAARAFFIDAFRWTCASASPREKDWRHASATGLLLAPAIALLPYRRRHEIQQPRTLSLLFQRRIDTFILETLDQMSLLRAPAALLLRMEAGAARILFEDYLLPYLRQSPLAAQDILRDLIVDAPENLPLALELLASATHRLLSPALDEGGAFQEAIQKSKSLNLRTHRREIRQVLQTLQPRFSQLAHQDELAAVAVDALDAADRWLAQPPDESPSVAQRLVTPRIRLRPGARMIVEFHDARQEGQPLRDLHPEVQLLDSQERLIRDALEPPPDLPRLELNERREVAVELLPEQVHAQEAKLRVRLFMQDPAGVQRAIKTRASDFTIMLEAPETVPQPSPPNPYLAGGSVKTLKGIYGREKEIQKIRRTLVGSHQDNMVLVLGERRIGKTTLLNALEQDEELRERYLTHREDLQYSKGETDPLVLYRTKLLHHLRTTLRNERLEALPVDESRFKQSPPEAFKEFMRAVDQVLINSDRRLLLILDELDQLLENTSLGDTAIATLRSIADDSRRISFIFSGATDVVRRYSSTRQHRLFKLGIEVEIGVLEEVDARKLIQEPARGHYEMSGNAVDLILRETNRHPYLIQYTCHRLFERMIERCVNNVTATDVEEVLDEKVVDKAEAFVDFVQAIPPEDILLVKALARLQRGNRYVDLSSMRRQLRLTDLDIELDVLRKRMQQLKTVAPMVLDQRLATDSYRLRIGLFARHLRHLQGSSGSLLSGIGQR